MNELNPVIAVFTEMASDYEQTVDREIRQFWGIGYREFISRFIARMSLTGRESVLDIATGMAVVPVTLLGHAQWQGDVTGLDITPDMLAGARNALESSGIRRRVRLICGSGMLMPLQSRSFDAVTCALATHHMNVPMLLREIRRVLRPDGQLLLADVGFADFWTTRRGRVWVGVLATVFGWTQGKVRAQAELDAMKNVLSPETWRSMLIAAGFSDVGIEVLPARRRWYPPGLLIRAYSRPGAE